MSIFDIFKKERGPEHPYVPPYKDAPLTAKALEDIFADCSDFQTRELLPGLENGARATAVWLDGIVDGDSVSNDIFRPFTEKARLGDVKTAQECVRLVLEGAAYANTCKKRDTAADVADDLTHGWCAVIFDGAGVAVTFEVRTSNTRSISEPTLEKSIKGAKDSFVETLRINTSLVRRRICTPKLKALSTDVGRKTLTRCAVMYIDGVADPKVVEELMARLDKIDVDGLVAAGYLEEYIVDRPRSMMPQIVHTERPDRFATQLLNGRVGILVDGLSIGFMVPCSLPELMRVPQSNSNNYIITSVLSLLRWLALFFSLTLPALLVAVTMYHQEMIPTKLLLSMIQAKQDVPFSVAVEVISMLAAFGFLQEAGLRLPNPVGDTVSIIGALIVGQSAVDAKVVSPVAVIVVAMAGICGYTLPSQDLSAAMRLFRLILVVLAILLGLYGIAVGLCLLVWYLCGMESFGVNYLSPLTDGRPQSLSRTILRPYKPDNKYRDPDLHSPDRRRQA